MGAIWPLGRNSSKADGGQAGIILRLSSAGPRPEIRVKVEVPNFLRSAAGLLLMGVLTRNGECKLRSTVLVLVRERATV